MGGRRLPVPGLPGAPGPSPLRAPARPDAAAARPRRRRTRARPGHWQVGRPLTRQSGLGNSPGRCASVRRASGRRQATVLYYYLRVPFCSFHRPFDRFVFSPFLFGFWAGAVMSDSLAKKMSESSTI
jgi:hypothetical protein